MARAIAEAEVQHVRKPVPAAGELSIPVPVPEMNRSYEDIVAGITERAKDESAR